MLLALGVPAGLSAAIVPNQGMAGVKLGMTRDAVKAALGEPLRIIHGTNDFGSYTEFRYPFLVRVTFQGDATVSAVSTTGNHERTGSGLGVGSSERSLRSGLGGLRCETIGDFRHCYFGRFTPGRRVTDFRIVDGLVSRVVVGFVID